MFNYTPMYQQIRAPHVRGRVSVSNLTNVFPSFRECHVRVRAMALCLSNNLLWQPNQRDYVGICDSVPRATMIGLLYNANGGLVQLISDD